MNQAKESVQYPILLSANSTTLCCRTSLTVANICMILFDGGLKILKSKEEFNHWGYLPDNK